MNKATEILSDIVVFSKYARYIPEIGRRETWEEIVTRNMAMHRRKFPHLKGEIKEVYERSVLTKRVLPSMRSLQFAGRPVEVNPVRIYNCAYLPINHTDAFSELMFLLLSGTGAGFSVQKQHVAELPMVKGPQKRNRRYVVGDSIEGWSDAIKVLVESYFYGKENITFDFSDIREKGTRLVTSGGKAPGPQPLKDCVHNIEKVLKQYVGSSIPPIAAHDICCYVADAVLAGGIRRAALISLFSRDDMEMVTCKSGSWWELNPQRGRANNSVVLPRGKVGEEEFKALWKRVEASGAGEPGIYWTNNEDIGSNPCAEISLLPFQMCNLCEVNVSDVTSQEDLNQRVRDGAFLGTLQAAYTDFHYLRPIWKDTVESEALIGVGMTGIGSGAVLTLNLEEAAEEVKKENARVADILNINCAARTTTIKPSGTSSLVLGTSSGVHAYHNSHYIRRMRLGKDEALYKYLAKEAPQLVEDEFFRPDTQAVVGVVQKAPEGSIVRTEHFMDLLERVKKFNLEWVRNGHRTGDNTHNVSCTISLKPEEWAPCGEWMWRNRHSYNGISVLPYDGGTYPQMPFEDITEEAYNQMEKLVTDIDLTKVVEEEDNTDLQGEAACAGGACEVK